MMSTIQASEARSSAGASAQSPKEKKAVGHPRKKEPFRQRLGKRFSRLRPSVLYGFLMVLTGVILLGFFDELGPHLGVNRIEAVALLTAVLLAAAVIHSLAHRARHARQALTPLFFALPVGIITGVATGGVSWRTGIAATVFGILTLYFAGRLAAALADGDTMHFERHWGGLGGNLRGWRTTRPVIYLAATLGFGVLLGVVLIADGYSSKKLRGQGEPAFAVKAALGDTGARPASSTATIPAPAPSKQDAGDTVVGDTGSGKQP